MKTRYAIVPCVAAIIAAAAHAQDPATPETLRSGLREVLSLLSFGSVSVPDQAMQVTRSGAEYHVQLPLTGFAAPAGATAEAIARPAAYGAWDVTSLTFPPAGAIGASIDQVVSYTVDQQMIHGRLDSGLKAPSTLVAELGTLALQSATGGQATEQTIARMTLDGTLSAASGGRVDVLAHDSATNWHAIMRDPAGVASDNLVQHVDGHVSLTDLDRTQGMHLVAAARALTGTARSPRAITDLSAAGRRDLRQMLDATVGLLSRFEVDETLSGLTFNLGPKSAGALGRMQVHAQGSAADQRLSAGIDIDMGELTLAAVSADTRTYLPHHLTVHAILAGLPIGPLLALLQTAIVPNADPAALQAQANALLNTPGAKAGVESIAFDSGPLRVRGSAQFVLRGDGEIGADIHIAAAGVDILLAQAQGRPALQGILPMVFLAKGMGHVQGDNIVWDISLGGGPLTINGIPFGQPAERSR